MRWILIALVASLGCVSLARGGEPEGLELAVGEVGQAGGLEIRFERLVGDSRCPEGVTCVWAGDAEVELVVRGSGDPVSVRLHTNLEPKFVRVGDLAVALEAVEPYPQEGGARGEVRVVLKVGEGAAAEGGAG